MVNKRNEKSSLDSATVVAQAIEAGGFVEFDINRILTGCSIAHAGGSNVVQLLTPGLYLVMFNGDLVADAAGEITVQMYNNNVALAGASTTITAVAATDYQIAFSALVRVLPSCCYIDNTSNIQVGLSAAGTITNGHIVVVKQA